MGWGGFIAYCLNWARFERATSHSEYRCFNPLAATPPSFRGILKDSGIVHSAQAFHLKGDLPSKVGTTAATAHVLRTMELIDVLFDVPMLHSLIHSFFQLISVLNLRLE